MGSPGKPGPGDRWWCSEGCGFTHKNHQCEQWGTTYYIPIEAIKEIKEEVDSF
jgi:hypothetical protein